MLTHLALLKPALQALGDLWGRPNQVLTHLALLRPALQALGDLWGRPNQVLTHLALLRSALQALGGVRAVEGACLVCIVPAAPIQA